MSEANANPRARKDHLTQLLLSTYLHLVVCKGTSKPVQEQTLIQGWLDTVVLLAAAGKQSPYNPPSQCCKTELSPCRKDTLYVTENL